MNSEQMRELADVLWNLMARFTYESDRTPLRDASTFLRQCAEQRPCTCHPDDNPPVPCAQKYALNECRAASEPTEAQIEAAADELYARRGMVSNECYAIVAERMLRAALAVKE